MAEAPAPAPGPAPAPAPTNPAASKVRKMSWGAISSIMKKAKADAPPPPAPQPRGQPPKDKNKDKKKWNGEHELVDGVWQGRWEGAEEKEEIGEQPEEAARRREQQESWKETLPWLSVEKKKRCAVPGCTGCNLCALLFCTLCIDRMTPPCANSTCNKFCSVGSDWFHHDAVKRHAANYHSHDITCKSRKLPNELSKRSRVASFASDGASVLTGRLHGVAVLLQQRWNMFMLVVHCIAHRYALGAEDASKDNHVAEYVEANMHSVVNYHSNSTQRREHLEKLQASLQVKVLMIIKFIETRWLCRGGVAARLHTTIGPIYYEFKPLQGLGHHREGAHARAPRLGTATSPRVRGRTTSMTYYGRRP